MTRAFRKLSKVKLFLANDFGLNRLEHTSPITISVLSEHGIGGREDWIGWHFAVKLWFTAEDDIRFVKVKKNLKFRETRWTLKAVAIDDHPFKPEDTLVWVGGAGSWQVDRLLIGDGVGWTWTMLMLSEDSFRILVSACEERSRSELGFLISEKGRFFEVVTHVGQLHGKLTVKEASLVYSAGVTTFDVTPTYRGKHRIESLCGYVRHSFGRLNISFYYS